MKDVFFLKTHANRIYGLDILRAFAILFVVFVHSERLLPKWLFNALYYFILDGVSIFFVLSGFLIGGILIKTFEKEKPSRKILFNFWIRRWLRTIPNYILILTTLFVLKSLYREDFKVVDYLDYYIFSQNLFSVHPAFFSEAWSLSVEEWFYLLIPMIILFLFFSLKQSIKKSVFITAILIIVLITFYRYITFSEYTILNYSDWDSLIRKRVSTRLDSLMYGVLGAFVSYYYNQHWLKHKKWFFGFGMFIFILLKIGIFSNYGYNVFYSVFSLSLFSLATLCVLPLLSTFKKEKGLLYKIFTFISLISYSMYLIHLSIVQGWIIGKIDFSSWNLGWLQFLVIKNFLYWGLTIIISFLLYKYFEVPMMNLRDRIKIK